MRFVVSTRADIEPWLELAPAMEFKLDADEGWDRPSWSGWPRSTASASSI